MSRPPEVFVRPVSMAEGHFAPLIDQLRLAVGPYLFRSKIAPASDMDTGALLTFGKGALFSSRRA
jgi:hypothetical protein